MSSKAEFIEDCGEAGLRLVNENEKPKTGKSYAKRLSNILKTPVTHEDDEFFGGLEATKESKTSLGPDPLQPSLVSIFESGIDKGMMALDAVTTLEDRLKAFREGLTKYQKDSAPLSFGASKKIDSKLAKLVTGDYLNQYKTRYFSQNSEKYITVRKPLWEMIDDIRKSCDVLIDITGGLNTMPPLLKKRLERVHFWLGEAYRGYFSIAHDLKESDVVKNLKNQQSYNVFKQRQENFKNIVIDFRKMESRYDLLSDKQFEIEKGEYM